MIWHNQLLRISNKIYNNLITNGNFANTMAGWTALSGTTVISNNACTFTGNGSNVSVRMYNDSISFLAEHKVYARAKIKVANSTCLSIRIYTTSNNYTIATVSTPIYNQLYEINGIFTATPTSGALAVAHSYSTAADSNGKSAIFSNILAVDLTSRFGAGNEPSLTWCDKYLTDPWIIY